jgi:crotonobetainyl-CoA:carnitine CoA-transferase CaiB-like acyl-CoA transferase
MWRRFVETVNADVLRASEYATGEGRSRHAADVLDHVQSILLTDTSGAWAERLSAAGVACTAINNLTDALADQQAVSRQLVARETVADVPFLHARGPVPALSAGEALPPPLAGQHTDEVLRDLGFSDERRPPPGVRE